MERGKGILEEFKEFINRGNVFETAVGLVMALAFTPVVNSLVDDVIMQIIARLVGEPDFGLLTIPLGGDVDIRIGLFINAAITFTLMAVVVFLLVKLYNQMMRRQEEEPEEPAGPSEVELLIEIRDLLRR
jgi:large conductance mechanosensitive channel